jgi:hypothetical protein
LPPQLLPDDFSDRLLVGFFGATVIGQLYTWPLAALLLYLAPKLARAAPHPALAALVAVAALLLLLYLRFILGRGFRQAEVTPNVLEAGPDDQKNLRFWWQRAPLRKWRQWARLRRFVGAALVRVGPPLDPSRAYVFAGFPHGISAISAFANLVVDPAGWVEDEGDENEEERGEQEAQSKPAADGDGRGDASPSPSPSPSSPSAAADRHRGTFRELFPGLSMHAMTLASNFKAPLVREYCLSLGLRPATRTSCAALLLATAAAAAPAGAADKATAALSAAAPSPSALRRRRGGDSEKETTPANDKATSSPQPPPPFRPAPGRAIFLAPGGAAEALLSRPGGNYDVLLARRKGFCRVALATGADVVPVLLFGETELFDVWHPPAGSVAWRVQRLSHRLFGTSQPIFRGEGLFGAQYTGLLPRRWSPGCGRPRLTTVVGQPVRVEGGPWRGGGGGGEEGEGGASCSSPPSWPPRIPKRGADPAFEAAVDALHARYCNALKTLFEEHRRAYHPQGAELRVADDGEGGEGGGAAAASSSRMQH